MGVTTSGLEPLDPPGSIFPLNINPAGEKPLDTFTFRMCGERPCVHDPTSSGSYRWEQMRREDAAVPALQKHLPGDIQRSVSYPDTEVTLQDESSGQQARTTDTYVIRLPLAKFF